MKLPSTGIPQDEILARLDAYRKEDVDWRSGRVWGYVYDAGVEAQKACEAAFADFLWENALDPTVFPSMLKLENDLVSMVAQHLNAPEGAVGNFTSGGTESIFLAVLAARENFRRKKGTDAIPEIVLPETAHAAHQKAAYYYHMKAVIVPIDPVTFKADVAAMRAAITENTCLLVGSATSYAHGVVDPIEELGQLALEHDLRLHVDGCIGGWLLPWFERLGANVPLHDFQVPGVSSMSCDLHKYGFAPKGASIIVHRDKSMRQQHMYACATWSGYTLVNNAVQSSKSGGPMAAAWAALHFMGDEGYLELARRMRQATLQIIEGIDALDGLRVLGRPEMNLIAIASDDPGVNIFHVADEMNLRGWYVQPQLSYGASPANIHLSVNPKSQPHVPSLLADFAASVEAARKLPSSQIAPMLKDAFATIDPADFDDKMLDQMLGMAGMSGVALPKRMAEINEVMDVIPTAFREKLLTTFVNELFQFER